MHASRHAVSQEGFRPSNTPSAAEDAQGQRYQARMLQHCMACMACTAELSHQVQQANTEQLVVNLAALLRLRENRGGSGGGEVNCACL
eukprot:1152765-Pelagomonas_calceolata.AAC.1